MDAVVLIAPEWLEAVYPEGLRARLAATPLRLRVNPGPAWWEDEEARWVRYLFTGWGAPMLAEPVLDRLGGLECVFHAGGSLRQLLPAAFWRRSVRVTTAAGVNALPVAEYTYAMIVLSLKQVWLRARALGEGRPWTGPAPGGLFRARVGLLSLSRIARQVLGKLEGGGAEILAYDPTVGPAAAAALGVRLATLEEIFAECDVVSCHTPLLDATRGLIGRDLLQRMRPGAVFINTARGAIVREDQLIEVLSRRPDLFAVLDVTLQDPPGADSPLRGLSNVMLTPHIAGSVGRECLRLGEFVADEFGRLLRGEELLGEVRGHESEILA